MGFVRTTLQMEEKETRTFRKTAIKVANESKKERKLCGDGMTRECSLGPLCKMLRSRTQSGVEEASHV